ncbi:MAG: CocE/NonD family hydrolase [Spirosomataceae bacterium]
MRPFIVLLLLLSAKLYGQVVENSSADVLIQKNILVPMRDGIKLSCNLYFPAKDGQRLEGKFPVLLCRSPYDLIAQDELSKRLTRKGYILVLNYVRGRFASEGTWGLMTHDSEDGYDIVEWIARQEWSSGKVGTFGVSYNGGTQHALAEMNPPHLTAMIPTDAFANVGVAGLRHGGAFELRWANWIIANHGPFAKKALEDPIVKRALDAQAKSVKQIVQNLPLKKGTTSLKLIPEYESWLIEAMQHGDNDAFWRKIGLSVVDNTQNYANVPVYHVSGWYDSWTRQTVMSWQALSKAKTAPQHLILGPWTHGGQNQNFAGDVEFPKEAALNIPEWYSKWFDHWLKGIDNGAEKTTKVRLFVMGGGSGLKSATGKMQHGGYWRDEHEFPLARTQFTPYYFHADGTLSTQKTKAMVSSTTYRFDPANPVPTVGGNISSEGVLMERGGMNQRSVLTSRGSNDTLPLSIRNDILVFQTELLEQDVEVTGPVEVKLWISSTAIDTDFTAKLVDVYPSNQDYPAGYELNIGDSIIRTRYRNSLTKQELMKPGSVYPVTITLYPTSNLFKKGHRIRVDISSSNFPRFDINPNTGDALQQSRRMMVADNTVFHDAVRASHILLPIIPIK